MPTPLIDQPVQKPAAEPFGGGVAGSTPQPIPTQQYQAGFNGVQPSGTALRNFGPTGAPINSAATPTASTASPMPKPPAPPPPPPAVMPKPTPAGPDTPVSNQNRAGPLIGDETPMPKPRPVTRELPIPKPTPQSPQELRFTTPSGRRVATIEEVNYEIFGTSRPAAANLTGEQQAAQVAQNREVDNSLRSGFTQEMRMALNALERQGASPQEIEAQMRSRFPEAYPGQSGGLGQAGGYSITQADVDQRLASLRPSPGPFVPGEPLISGGAPALGGSASQTSGGYQTFGRQDGSIDFLAGVAATDRNAVTRQVQDNELTSRQLSRLIDENGRYIQAPRLNAREGAAGSGMLLSSVAAGAAERAAIDAAAPIAQADASVFANTASENMRAQNEDAMADQMAGRSLLSQSEQQQFNSRENVAQREFQAGENAAERAERRFLQADDQQFRGTQADLDRSQQRFLQADDQRFRAGESEIERQTRIEQAAIDRGFNREENERREREQRIATYNNLIASREQGLSQQLAAIFSNPNLTPQQQQQAAENARALHASMSASFNAAFAAGVPEIFMNPYGMQPQPPGAQPQPVQLPTLPPGSQPIAGTDLVRGPDGIIRSMADAIRMAQGRGG